ncbi:MAG: PUA domain-containing protein [Candidatus Heimdallarchaeaceae archaeon]
MTTPNDTTDNELMPGELISRFLYHPSLLHRWLDQLGINYTIDLLSTLRRPNESIWVQVNKSKIDFDSLLDIFEDMEFSANKHPLFDDFIQVKIGLNEFDETVKELPMIKVDRESTTSIALGKDVNSTNVTEVNEFFEGDTVRIIDFVGNIIAIGIAEIHSTEVKDKTVRIAAKNIKSLGITPQLTELMVYRRGYFNILSPTQALSVKATHLKPEDNILVMTGDKGDVASYIAELTNNKCPITLIVINKLQLKAARRQKERTKSKAIRIIKRPFLQYLEEQHEMKYSVVFLEPQNSRTAIMPTFSSNLGVSKLETYATAQKKIITNLFRCLYDSANITYFTHSVDISENEDAYNHAMSKAYYEDYKFTEEVRKLQKKEIVSYRGLPEEKYLDYTFEHKNSTIYIDPVKTNNTGGYIAKFKFGKKDKIDS